MSKTQTHSRQYSRAQTVFPPSVPSIASLWRHKRLACIVALLTAIAGILAALAVTPVYEGRLVIQIDRPPSSDTTIYREPSAATEMEILQARALVSRVVRALHLDLVVEPRSLPLIGGLIARASPPLQGLMGASRMAEARERVQVQVLNVPVNLLGQRFVLTSAAGSTFFLTQRERGITIHGRTGERSSTRTPYGVIDLLVTKMQTEPGTQFTLIREHPLAVVERLRRALRVVEQGKASKVIGVTLKGGNPEWVSRVLNRLGQEYIAQYVAQRDAVAAQTLAFHDRQLLESGQRLKAIDERIARAISSLGGMNIDSETVALSQQLTLLQTRLIESEQRMTELSTRVLDQHPAMIGTRGLIANLRADLDQVKARHKAAALAQAEISRLTRDRLAEQELAAELMRSRSKLIMAQSFGNREVSILDPAETPIHDTNISPLVMATVACLAGLLAGVAAALLKQGFEARNSRMRTLCLQASPGANEVSLRGAAPP